MPREDLDCLAPPARRGRAVVGCLGVGVDDRHDFPTDDDRRGKAIGRARQWRERRRGCGRARIHGHRARMIHRLPEDAPISETDLECFWLRVARPETGDFPANQAVVTKDEHGKARDFAGNRQRQHVEHFAERRGAIEAADAFEQSALTAFAPRAAGAPHPRALR